ncbi:MAG TPA: sigma 54-interacting transcriptional regulator [Deltaproteobacteria bacterium]|nr:sigma 54-interacting transcriptional regulator [Deltaproteobacteria bacterium]HOI06789.1 sigma 54-interacting transcriptional regulator [Deltaproteobacteria bacterium]
MAVREKRSNGEAAASRLDPVYEERYRKTFLEWDRYVKGAATVDPAVVPREVFESWERCRRLKVNPLHKPSHEILKDGELKRLLKDNSEFISICKPFLLNLYRFVKGSRFVVGLFDRQGYVLDVMHGDEEAARENLFLEWFPGVRWDEESSGNNAAGTVLTLKRPIRIFGTQHYNRTFHKLTVSSAPIFNPEGELMGGLTLTAYYYGVNPHTLGMAVAAAQAIENELRAQKALHECKAAFAETELAFSLQKSVIECIPEPLVALDSRGCVSIINDKARDRFGLEEREVKGKHIREISGEVNHRFLSMIETDEAFTDADIRIFTREGYGDYTLTCNLIRSPAGKVMGKILIFSEIKRIKTLVTKMIGAKAKIRFEDICGKNPRFLMTLEQARLISQSSSNALLLGESGTGKDIFAQAIHNASLRRDGPYVAINCAAIPRDLISSELFGYSEGAFTGSKRGGNQGKFELADGGTIFLDEIAETPLELQAALLRVIEDKSVIRIGGSRVRPVDTRIIAATNKDLLEEVRRGNFRKDLYYRLNVFTINMLPLSQRLDDIPLLVDLFVRKYGKTLDKKISRIDEKVMETFMRYSWPGNVRELQNVIERMMNYAQSDELTIDLVPQEIQGALHAHGPDLDMESPIDAEKKLISRMLTLKFPKRQIAERMNVSRTTLFRKMKKYGLA